MDKNVIQTNLAIIGGGASGLAAAVAAAENGVNNIVIIEKQKVLGGFARFAHGFFGCESPVQKRAMLDIRADTCFKIHMDWAHWFRVDPPVVRAFINKSGDTIRWLEEKGMNFTLRTSYPNHLAVWHMPEKRGMGYVNLMKEFCASYGIETMCGASAKTLLQRPDGSVYGVDVATDTGETFKLHADQVILASGGFAGNLDLLYEYCPVYSSDIPVASINKFHTGDGLIMAEAAGAAIAKTIPILCGGHGADANPAAADDISALAMEPYTLWLTGKGKRFTDEGTYTADFAACHLHDKITYTLLDEDMIESIESDGVIVGHAPPEHEVEQRTSMPGLKEMLRKEVMGFHGSLVKVADTLEEIAGWMGAPPETLRETVEQYNNSCDRGYDELFVKDPYYLRPIRKSPYYAIRCSVGYHDTMGGVRVTESMQVRNVNDEIIPGLYTVGALADGWEPDVYNWNLCSFAFGFSINSGRIAGEKAAEVICGKT